MHLDVCYICLIDCVRVGLDWAEPMMQFILHVTCSCIFHAFVRLFNILIILNCFGAFLIIFFSLPLLLVMLVVSVAPKHKSTLARSPFHSGASSSSDHVPLPLFVSIMMMPTRHLRKTFLNETLIRNAKSSWVILLTPSFPLSFTVGNRSLFVTSLSLVLSC